METVMAFVVSSVEAKRFGMNVSTFWAMGAGLMTFVQAYGSYNLVNSIHKNESGEGVSFCMLGYWHALMWCFVYYAWSIHSVAVMFSGIMLAPLYSAALFAISRYECFTPAKFLKIILPLLVLPTAFVFVERKDILLLASMVLGLIFFLDQARILYVEKRVGSFDPRFTIAIMMGNVFWFFFAISVGDLALTVINPVILTISLLTLHAYARARRYEQIAS